MGKFVQGKPVVVPGDFRASAFNSRLLTVRREVSWRSRFDWFRGSSYARRNGLGLDAELLAQLGVCSHLDQPLMPSL